MRTAGVVLLAISAATMMAATTILFWYADNYLVKYFSLAAAGLATCVAMIGGGLNAVGRRKGRR